MKTILYLTDFSEGAYSALKYTVSLLKDTPCKFIIAHSIKSEFNKKKRDSNRKHNIELANRLVSRNQELCEQVAKDIQQDLPSEHHHYFTKTIRESLFTMINRLYNKNAVDLTVLGTRGRSGLKNLVLGSTATAMIKRVKKCPMLIVPPNNPFQGLKKVAFATDMEHQPSRKLHKTLLDIAQPYHPSIDILHVLNKNTHHAEAGVSEISLKESFEPLDTSIQYLQSDEKVSTTLAAKVHQDSYDLVALYAMHHHPLKLLIYETNTAAFLRKAQLPTLAIPYHTD